MKTEELIVQLTRSLEPVTPLASPSARLARWMAVSVLTALIGVVAIGPRADLLTAINRPTFAALLTLALATALAAAASALVLSVPGAERTPAQRGLPLVLLGAWTVTWGVLLMGTDAPMARLLALPLHAGCMIQMAVIALVPAWLLFEMMRRGAPLQLTWSAMLAGLGAAAVGGAATQIMCPLDDPAHHLAGHMAPMAVLAIALALGRRRSLAWVRRV